MKKSLILFLKKKPSKSSSSTPEDEKSNPFKIIPSAPPHVPEEDIVFSTYMLHGFLEIRTKLEIEGWRAMLDVLEVIVDKYTGPHYTRPFFESIYLLMGLHTIGRQDKEGWNTYRTELSTRVRVYYTGLTSDSLPTQWNWSNASGTGGKYTTIAISVDMEKTKRKGVGLLDLWNHPVDDTAPPSLFSDLGQYNWKISQMGNHDVIFHF
ncbi:matrix protein [Orgi virus]|uniref:Matrix protein n=1 Tax=Orgi virus TaxID=1911434 RepID=A0A2Z2CF60_9RHAB|nr:matrix protein [Orgi virus]AOX47520.1 matrix protein [Orgi virus]AOX47524.1 matrix protein [Orgi virus]